MESIGRSPGTEKKMVKIVQLYLRDSMPGDPLWPGGDGLYFDDNSDDVCWNDTDYQDQDDCFVDEIEN